MSRQARHNIITLFLIIFAVGCISSLWLFKNWRDELIAEPTIAEINATSQIPAFTQAQVERYIGASIPATASNINFQGYYIGLQDSEVFIRFTLPASDLPVLLEDLEITEPLQEQSYDSNLNYGYYRSIEWWQPQQSMNYSGIRIEPGPSLVLTLLVSKDNPLYYEVYIHKLNW